MEKKAGRMHFVRVCLEQKGGELFAASTGNQSSGVLSSMSQAHGLLLFAAELTQLRSASREWSAISGRERSWPSSSKAMITTAAP